MVKLQEATWLDYVRFVFSAALLTFSAVVTCYAILEQKTAFWNSVPGWAALIIFVVALFFLAVMEGLQIALVELKRQEPESFRVSHPRAYRIGELASKGDNVERFLLGRQVFVVCLVFFVAKLTTIHSTGGDFLFPVHPVIQVIFLETGLLACVLVVIVSQLLPQIIASKYPVQFMQLEIVMKPALLACLALEATGITHMCWVFATLVTRLLKIEDGNGEAVNKEDWEKKKNNNAKNTPAKDGAINAAYSGESRDYP
jgi:CBS domain containing-hemolysin-like protein